MTQAIAKKEGGRLEQAVGTKDTLETLLAGPNFQASVKAILPDHLKPERLLKMALVAASRQPTLYKCSQASVLQSLMRSAELGLDCSGTLGLGYLVPYWSTKVSGYECQFIPGYRGIIELAKRSNAKFQVEARTVFANDVFEFEYGLHPKLVHLPTLGADRGDIIFFYCVSRQPGMEPEFTVMTRSEIDAIMHRSNSKDRNGKIVGPWVSDYEEMGRKTVTKRHLKYQSLSVEVQQAINLDDVQYNGHAIAVANEASQSVGVSAVREKLVPTDELKEPNNVIDVDPEPPDHNDTPAEAPPDVDEPETDEPTDPLESLRANVQSRLEELPKPTQKNMLAGKSLIRDMAEAELTALNAEIDAYLA